MTVNIYKFNNLYNRIVKRYETLEDYEEAGELLGSFKQINFIPGDGIFTDLILDYPYEEHPDYLIVSSGDEIVSRWFVTTATRTRAQQYHLELVRDVIAEWYNEVVNAPMFIEKGFVSAGDPAIFNNETMTYNQIKTSEKLLKDFSNTPWIVGYVAKNLAGKTISIPAPTVHVDYLEGFESYTYNNYREDGGGKFYANPTNYCARLNVKGSGAFDTFCFAWDKNGNSIMPFNPSARTGEYYSKYLYKKTEQEGFVSYITLNELKNLTTLVNQTRVSYMGVFEDVLKGYNWSEITSYNYGINSSTDLEQLQAENGKIIKNGDSYYQIQVYTVGNDSVYSQVINDSTGLYSQMESIKTFLGTLTADGKSVLNENTPNPVRPYLIETQCTSYKIRYIPITIETLNLTFSSDRISCKDQPYDIFAIPFGRSILNQASLSSTNPKFADYTQKLFGSPLTDIFGVKCDTTTEAAYQLAQTLIKELGDNLYDVQLLPFCPINQKYHDGGKYSVTFLPGQNNLDTRAVNPLWYDYQQAQGYTIRSIISYMWWIDSAQFSFELTENIQVPDTALEFKVANETEKYRLVSPNYNGQFEFSATKNGGIFGWTIDCAYKPYQPYIKIAPLFGRLYGKDFNDARGLILGGDFSLSQLSDAWTQYQINNKNFQNQFDRQIENMEVNNSVQRELERWNIAAGTVGAVGSGFVTGSIASGGNPAAGAVGGILSGGMSLAAGIRDAQLNEKLRQEAIDYTKDQFGYQLQNIQALPYSLTKVSTFNPNYKLFPILEFYTCTDVEKQALRDKIKYNGMTIMRIGTINEFIDPQEKRYIKGKVIRIEDLPEDFHVANAIANELYKGVFI